MCIKKPEVIVRNHRYCAPALNNFFFFSKSKHIRLNSERGSPNKVKGWHRLKGRNKKGQITSFHRGGGHKKKYRSMDNYRYPGLQGVVYKYHYDSYRKVEFSKVFNPDKKKWFNIGFFSNSKKIFLVRSYHKAGSHPGHHLKLCSIPAGSAIRNLTLDPYKPSKYIKAKNSFGQLLQRGSYKAQVRLPSKKILSLFNDCCATISLPVKRHIQFFKKAGEKRWLGVRPTVRGVAMNPIDHPHGGGEGKASGGRPSVSPWGKPIKSPKGKTKKN